MKITLFAAAVAAVTLIGSAAQAQVPTPTPAPSGASRQPAGPPAATGLFLAVEGGMQAVQNIGAMAGVQLGAHLSPRLSVFAETTYLQDVVTRRRNETAAKVASFLAASQGKTASGELALPTTTIGGGVRYVLTASGAFRPYVMAQVAMARMTFQPTFTLGGADVTASLAQYGVTLGSDLSGTSTKPAFGGGFGVVNTRGPWSIDVGIRVLSIKAEGQAANVKTLSVGIGRRF